MSTATQDQDAITEHQVQTTNYVLAVHNEIIRMASEAGPEIVVAGAGAAIAQLCMEVTNRPGVAPKDVFMEAAESAWELGLAFAAIRAEEETHN